MSTEDRSVQITRRKFLTWSCAAALSAGLAPMLAAGCGSAGGQQPSGGSAPAPTAAAKAVAPTQPPAKAGAIELKLSHHDVETSYIGKAYQAYADAVAEKSGGKIHITVYPSATLSPAADAYGNVVSGVADIAWTPISFLPGQFPLTEAYNLPMSGIASGLQSARAATEWYKTDTNVQKEWEEVHPLATYSPAPMFLSSAKKAVRKMEDMAGLKVMVPGSSGPVAFIQSLGASVSVFPPPDLYQSLTKGVVDTYLLDWQGILSFNVYEITKYSMPMGIFSGFSPLVMNKQKWESLSPDLQAIMEDPGLKPSLAEYFGTAFDASTPDAEAALKKAGGEVITFAADEVARWKAKAQPIWDSWVQKAQGKGFDPAKELDALHAIIKKYA